MTRERKRRRAQKVYVCRRCKGENVQRVHRRGLLDAAFSLAGFYPHLCTDCWRRCRRGQWEQFALLAAIAVVVIAGAAGVFAIYKVRRQTLPAYVELGRDAVIDDPSAVLYNTDVVELVKGGGTLDNIKQRIRTRHHKFLLDIESLARLKALGVPDDVIATMVDASTLPVRGQTRVPNAPELRVATPGF